MRSFSHRIQAALNQWRRAIIALTLLAIVVQAAPWIPRPVIDYSQIPLLDGIDQPETFGSDTVADSYEARVVLNDVGDMYTKRKTAQTELEAHYWTPASSAPYPPVLLLTEAAMYAVSGHSLEGFYLAVLGVAALFLALSLVYCLRTRWFLFPLLYLNFQYLGERFVWVQDCSYLIMLTVVMMALLAARTRPTITHTLMAIATTMKLSPLFYATEVFRMRRAGAVVFIGVLAAGLLVPWFLWENYLYIYSYGAALKGSSSSHLSAWLATPIIAAGVWYAGRRHNFDLEDRLGWALVPMAFYFAVYSNSARHLLLALLIPDKRVWRNIPVPIGLTLHTFFPEVVRLGSVLSISIGLLVLILVGYAVAPATRPVK